MTTVQDPAIKPKPPVWKIILNLIYSGMSVLKGMGLFNWKSGPDIKK